MRVTVPHSPRIPCVSIRARLSAEPPEGFIQADVNRAVCAR